MRMASRRHDRYHYWDEEALQEHRHTHGTAHGVELEGAAGQGQPPQLPRGDRLHEHQAAQARQRHVVDPGPDLQRMPAAPDVVAHEGRQPAEEQRRAYRSRCAPSPLTLKQKRPRRLRATTKGVTTGGGAERMPSIGTRESERLRVWRMRHASEPIASTLTSGRAIRPPTSSVAHARGAIASSVRASVWACMACSLIEWLRGRSQLAEAAAATGPDHATSGCVATAGCKAGNGQWQGAGRERAGSGQRTGREPAQSWRGIKTTASPPELAQVAAVVVPLAGGARDEGVGLAAIAGIGPAVVECLGSGGRQRR